MTEITIPTKAVWAQMLIDQYSEMNTAPTKNVYETVAFIVRDLVHFMMLNDVTRPDVATAALNIGVASHLSDMVSENPKMPLNDMVEQFKDLLQKARNPVVPAGFEKFMPGAHH